jgi:hypothetical protein
MPNPPQLGIRDETLVEKVGESSCDGGKCVNHRVQASKGPQNARIAPYTLQKRSQADNTNFLLMSEAASIDKAMHIGDYQSTRYSPVYTRVL